MLSSGYYLNWQKLKCIPNQPIFVVILNEWIYTYTNIFASHSHTDRRNWLFDQQLRQKPDMHSLQPLSTDINQHPMTFTHPHLAAKHDLNYFNTALVSDCHYIQGTFCCSTLYICVLYLIHTVTFNLLNMSVVNYHMETKYIHMQTHAIPNHPHNACHSCPMTSIGE